MYLVSDMMRFAEMEDDGVAATNMRMNVQMRPMSGRIFGNSKSSLEQNKVKLRDYFPESWLFSLNYTNELTR